MEDEFGDFESTITVEKSALAPLHDAASPLEERNDSELGPFMDASSITESTEVTAAAPRETGLVSEADQCVISLAPLLWSRPHSVAIALDTSWSHAKWLRFRDQATSFLADTSTADTALTCLLDEDDGPDDLHPSSFDVSHLSVPLLYALSSMWISQGIRGDDAMPRPLPVAAHRHSLYQHATLDTARSALQTASITSLPDMTRGSTVLPHSSQVQAKSLSDHTTKHSEVALGSETLFLGEACDAVEPPKPLDTLNQRCKFTQSVVSLMETRLPDLSNLFLLCTAFPSAS